MGSIKYLVLAVMLGSCAGCAGVKIKDLDTVAKDELRVCRSTKTEGELECITLDHFLFLISQKQVQDKADM